MELLNASTLKREKIIEQFLLPMMTSVAESIDVSLEKLCSAKTPRLRRSLGAGVWVFQLQMAKGGFAIGDEEIAAALKMPLALLRACAPSRSEKARALKAAGYSLTEAANLLHLHRATTNRLAATR